MPFFHFRPSRKGRRREKERQEGMDMRAARERMDEIWEGGKMRHNKKKERRRKNNKREGIRVLLGASPPSSFVSLTFSSIG